MPNSTHRTPQQAYRLAWNTQKRLPLLTDDMQSQLRTILGDLCREATTELLHLRTGPAHVRLLLRFPPGSDMLDLTTALMNRSEDRLRAACPDLEARLRRGEFPWQEEPGLWPRLWSSPVLAIGHDAPKAQADRLLRLHVSGTEQSGDQPRL